MQNDDAMQNTTVDIVAAYFHCILFYYYTVVQILVINIGICFASGYVFRADDLKLL